MQADYVIVGAGCVLATRLTEDANTSVILVEAGGDIDHHQRTHHHHRRKRRGHDQGGRAGAAGGLTVNGLVSQGEFEILCLAMGASYDP